MIHGLLPAFLVTVLGVSILSVGLIEGTAEATTSLVKIFSGRLSDRLGRRKALVIVGYGLSAVTKLLISYCGDGVDYLGCEVAAIRLLRSLVSGTGSSFPAG